MTLTNGIIANKLLSHPLTRQGTVVNAREPSTPEHVKMWTDLMQKVKAEIHTPALNEMNGTKHFPFPCAPLDTIKVARYQIQDRFCRGYYGPSIDAESLIMQHQLGTTVPAYTKFTSPLRRYQDVLVHAQVDLLLRTQGGAKVVSTTPTVTVTATISTASETAESTTKPATPAATATGSNHPPPSSPPPPRQVLTEARVARSQLRYALEKMDDLAMVSMLLRQGDKYQPGHGVCPFQPAYVSSLDREAEEAEVVMPHMNEGESTTMSLTDCLYPGATRRWVSDNQIEIEFSQCDFPSDHYPASAATATVTLLPLAPLWVRLNHTFNSDAGQLLNPSAIKRIEWWPEAVPAPNSKWQKFSTRVYMDYKAVATEVTFVVILRVTGKVKTWKHNKGFGFITGPDGDVFCHSSSVRDGDFLVVGATVQYSPTKTNKGIGASNVTGGVRADASSDAGKYDTIACPYSGVVSWWNDQRGFGKIAPDDADRGSTKDGLVFVRYSKIHNDNTLIEGQRVRFDSRDGTATRVVAEKHSPSSTVTQPQQHDRTPNPNRHRGGRGPRGYDLRMYQPGPNAWSPRRGMGMQSQRGGNQSPYSGRGESHHPYGSHPGYYARGRGNYSPRRDTSARGYPGDRHYESPPNYYRHNGSQPHYYGRGRGNYKNHHLNSYGRGAWRVQTATSALYHDNLGQSQQPTPQDKCYRTR